MNKVNALFTYGTLQPGEAAEHYLNQISGTWYDCCDRCRWRVQEQAEDDERGDPAL